MTGRPMHHVALRTHDVERLVRFYAGVLGLAEITRRVDARGLYSVWLSSGVAVVMVERAEPHEPAGPAAGSMDLLAFAVTAPEREDFRGRFTREGITLEAETAHTLYVRDPDGRRVGVSSYPW